MNGVEGRVIGMGSGTGQEDGSRLVTMVVRIETWGRSFAETGRTAESARRLC